MWKIYEVDALGSKSVKLGNSNLCKIQTSPLLRFLVLCLQFFSYYLERRDMESSSSTSGREDVRILKLRFIGHWLLGDIIHGHISFSSFQQDIAWIYFPKADNHQDEKIIDCWVIGQELFHLRLLAPLRFLSGSRGLSQKLIFQQFFPCLRLSSWELLKSQVKS